MTTVTSSASIEPASETLAGHTSAAPEWVHLLPAGELYTADGRGPYRVPNVSALLAESLPPGARLPVDENHATDLAAPRGDPAPARGWIVALEARADGIWGRVEWTGEGARLVTSRAYRGISPVIGHYANGDVARILRASLVNRPNLKGLVTLHGETTMNAATRAKIIDMLGIAADADDATMLIAIGLLAETKAMHAQQPDPAKFVPIGDFERAVKEVRRLDQGISLQAAEAYVADRVERGHMLRWMKDWAVELCMVNKPALDAFIDKTKPSLQRLLQPSAPAGPPPDGFLSGHAAADDAEAEVCRRMGISIEDYRKASGAGRAGRE